MKTANPLLYLVFAVGILVLAAMGFVLYAWFALGTEALLVPWQCNCSWDTRPALGTLQRTLNDFFAGPGRDLPSLLFVLVSGTIVAVRTWRAENRAWLPLLFSLVALLLFAADLVVTHLTWALSDWVVGPRTGGIDAGYRRTWYGVVGSLMLWIIFWVVLIRLPLGRPATAAQSS